MSTPLKDHCPSCKRPLTEHGATESLSCPNPEQPKIQRYGYVRAAGYFPLAMGEWTRFTDHEAELSRQLQPYKDAVRDAAEMLRTVGSKLGTVGDGHFNDVPVYQKESQSALDLAAKLEGMLK